MRLCLIVLAVLLTPVAYGAKILCLFGLSGKSHNNVFTALTTELARRGHDLTVVTAFPIESPPGKYRQIDVPVVRDQLMKDDIYTFSQQGILTKLNHLFALAGGICPKVLEIPEVQKLKEEKFDLVFVSMFFNECTIPFARHNNAPLILISPAGLMSSTAASMGNPEQLAYVPNLFLPFSDHMTLWQRAANTFVYYFLQLVRALVLIPSMTSAAREFFGDDIPSLAALESNASLALLNNHVSVNYPRPLLPNVIEVGAMHIKTTKEKMDKELEDFLDGAKEGVIYFSMGSIVRPEQFPETTVQAMNAAFSELPQRVIWKWNSDSLPGQASNVKFGKWLPQQAILGHPNVRLFITHGGLLSTQEAEHHGVPLVGIPVMGDQQLNVERSKLLGIAEVVDLHSLTKDTFLQATKKVVNTPSYKQKALELMSRVRDQPESPLERAVFWTEYVIRHEGAPHLRSAASHLAWYQLYLLDVIAAILVFLLLTAFITCKCTSALCTSKIKDKQPSERRSKKKQ